MGTFIKTSTPSTAYPFETGTWDDLTVISVLDGSPLDAELRRDRAFRDVSLPNDGDSAASPSWRQRFRQIVAEATTAPATKDDYS